MTNYARILRFLPKLFWKENALPVYFVFFVTHRCVAHCAHCFNGPRRSRIGRDDELTLEEIEKISRSMDPMIFMFLTGGEPFVRDDLSEIAEIFYRNNRIVKFQIPTNGWFTEKMVAQMERMARRCPRAHISATVSIDGIGEEHDRIRGLPGLFERATASIREIQRLARFHGNLGVNAEITVSARNQGSLNETFRYLTDRLGVGNVLTPLVRGEPRDPSCKDVDMESYNRMCGEIARRNRARRTQGYRGFPFARFITYKDIYSRDIVERIVKFNRSAVPCVAGRIYGILYANGEVEFCEMTDRHIGRLRDAGYDFRKVWLSAGAREAKRSISGKKCFCTHECALTASVLSDPKHLSKIIVNKCSDDVRFFFGDMINGGPRDRDPA